MAAGTITTVTIVDHLKQYLNQVGGDFMTDVQYTDAIMAHMDTDATASWLLQERTTGYFTMAAGGDEPLYMWFASSPFSPEDNLVYRLNAKGPTVQVTTGTHSGGDITINGLPVDFDQVLIDCLEIIQARHAKQKGIRVSSADISVENTYDTIERMIQKIRGAQALG